LSGGRTEFVKMDGALWVKKVAVEYWAWSEVLEAGVLLTIFIAMASIYTRSWRASTVKWLLSCLEELTGACGWKSGISPIILSNEPKVCFKYGPCLVSTYLLITWLASCPASQTWFRLAGNLGIATRWSSHLGTASFLHQ